MNCQDCMAGRVRLLLYAEGEQLPMSWASKYDFVHMQAMSGILSVQKDERVGLPERRMSMGGAAPSVPPACH